MTDQDSMTSGFFCLPESHRMIRCSEGKEFVTGRKRASGVFTPILNGNTPAIKDAIYPYAMRPFDGEESSGR